MPTPAKTTLNVLYQLTTEMGERRGWAQKAIKLIYCPWGGLDNLGPTNICLALHQEMELLGCYKKFIKNQIF